MSKRMITTGLALWALGGSGGCGGSEATEAPAAAASDATQGAEAPAPAQQAPAQQAAPAPKNLSEESQRIVKSFEAFNTGDLDGALAPASFELEYTVIGGETTKGKGHVRKLWETQRAGFPDMKRSVRRVIHTGETIAVEYVVTGTHTGEFEGHPASKQTIGYDALMIFHSDAQGAAHETTRITVYEDEPTLRRQIGTEKGEAASKSGAPLGAPEMVEGDGERTFVKFIKDWYAAIGPDWNQQCEKTYCTDDVAFYSMPNGASLVKQMDRSRYLDILVEGSKDLQVADVWVEPAGNYYVTFTTWKKIRPNASLGLPDSKHLIDLNVAQVIKLEGGKIREVSTYFNRRQAQSQLQASQAKLAK